MKIGIVGLLHESNSFMPATTTRQQFVQSALDVGEAIIDRWSEVVDKDIYAEVTAT